MGPKSESIFKAKSPPADLFFLRKILLSSPNPAERYAGDALLRFRDPISERRIRSGTRNRVAHLLARCHAPDCNLIVVYEPVSNMVNDPAADTGVSGLAP